MNFVEAVKKRKEGKRVYRLINPIYKLEFPSKLWLEVAEDGDISVVEDPFDGELSISYEDVIAENWKVQE